MSGLSGLSGASGVSGVTGMTGVAGVGDKPGVRRWWGAGVLSLSGLIAMCCLTGCERAMHDMYEQPKYKPGAPTDLFADGSSARTPPEGTLTATVGAATAGNGQVETERSPSDGANGTLGRRAHGVGVTAEESGTGMAATSGAPGHAESSASGAVMGTEVGETSAGAGAPPIALPLLQRGRERFDIYCAPCHGRSGDGAGMVVLRGFPAPPSYHTDNLRTAPDSHIYDVISNGYGVMYPYADRITPQDRWAIVAYIRALQLSQRAPRNLLAPADLAQLDKQGPR